MPTSLLSPARAAPFAYHGTSESLLAGLHGSLGSLVTGFLGSYSRTDLRYDARLDLPLYSAGEHDSETAAVHPYLGFHFSDSTVAWTTAGVGSGQVWFEDDLPPFDDERDARFSLRTFSFGGQHRFASLALGSFALSGLYERFGVDLDGDEDPGGIADLSVSGRDLLFSVDWTGSPSLALDPSVSLALRRQLGDGPSGDSLESTVRISEDGLLPHLTFGARAHASFGLGSHDADLYSLSGVVRYGPDSRAPGFVASLESRYASQVLPTSALSPDRLQPSRYASFGLGSELSFGLRGVYPHSVFRPYLSLRHASASDSARPALGTYLFPPGSAHLQLETFGGSRPGVLMHARTPF